MSRYIAALAGSGGPTGLQARLSVLKSDSLDDANELALRCAKHHYPHSVTFAVKVWPIHRLDTTIRPYPKHILLKGMTLRELLIEWWRQNHPKKEVSDGRTSSNHSSNTGAG